MSHVSMESSNPTSLTETKKQIILKHLGNLDEKRLETFKKALCQLKPRGGAKSIKMGNLKNKSLKEIIDFIFTYHTEKYGTQTVKKALEKMNENQTRMLTDKDLREATHRRKSVEPKKNEASTSKVKVDKQDGKQVHPSAPKMMVPTAPPLPRFELSAKNVEREKDRDAALEATKNKEGTASKNEGPAHNPPTPATQGRRRMEPKKNEASTSKVMADKQDGKQVHPSASKMILPTAPPVPRFELSAKNVEREKVRFAALEATKNKEGTASKNEGPAHNPPTPAFFCVAERSHVALISLAMQGRKSMETEKNEASTSNVMVDKQGGKQVHPSAPKMILPTAPPVPRFELSAKNVEREKDRDAALEAPKNKEGTASKNEGPAHNPPTPASTSKVMVDKQDGKQVHPSAPKMMVQTAPPVPRFELSAKNVEREKDRDAALEATKNKEGTASKNEGPAHNPPTPATHRRKSMEPKKIEASTSKVMADKQDGKVVTESVIIIDDDDDGDGPFSEPSAKKIKIEQDRDAELGVPENKEGTASKNEGPARNPPTPEQSQSEKAPPTISMEKKISNIIATHLKSLKEGDIEKFKEILCSEKPPIKNAKIQMSDIKDKSLEEMVDLIIRRHTLRRGPATVRKVLEHMKENHIKMMIQKDMRKLNQQQNKESQ